MSSFIKNKNEVTLDHPHYSLINQDKIVRNANAPQPTASEDEEIIKEIGRYVEAKIINIYGFYAISIPNEDSNPSTTILASNDWLNKNKLLIIIQNASGSLLGIFSRSICFEQGLNKGSVLPYIERALSADYGVIVLRPNTNSVIEEIPGEGPRKVPILGSESPEIHALCVWENVITKAENVTHIALLGYGNGAILCKDLLLRQMVRSGNDESEVNRIKAFITIEASSIVEEDDAVDVKEFVGNVGVNLECSKAPIGYRLAYRREKLGCVSLSVGLPAAATEVTNVAVSLSLSINPVFKYLKLAENGGHVGKIFSDLMAKENGFNPNSAEITVNPNIEVENDVVKPRDNESQATTKKGFFSWFGNKKKKSSSNQSNDDEKITVNDFELLKIVGKGAFGKVMLVKKKTGTNAGQTYAMKVLKKSVIAAKGQIENTISEREILCEIRHPFIVRLRFAFQSDDKLYLVTDYYNGGTLFYHLRKSRAFPEERAKFYAAELLLALDHLHSQHIIYRDLKLENILLDHLGHVALTDFGLSKQDIDKTGGATTFCGTAEYIAPELLQVRKYGKSVDWWSFGILLYEMMHGRTPFYDKNRKLMFYRIINVVPNFPQTFTPEACDCIRGLLTVNELERLGSGDNGARDIMNTDFFSVIDFDALLRKEISPPFQPEVNNETDTRYVPKAYLQAEAKDSIAEPVRRGDVAGNFNDFTFAGESVMD